MLFTFIFVCDLWPKLLSSIIEDVIIASCCWFFNTSIPSLFLGSNHRRLELASVPCGGTVNHSIFQGGAVQDDVGRIRTVKRHPHSRDTPRGGLWIICQNQNQNGFGELGEFLLIYK